MSADPKVLHDVKNHLKRLEIMAEILSRGVNSVSREEIRRDALQSIDSLETIFRKLLEQD